MTRPHTARTLPDPVSSVIPIRAGVRANGDVVRLVVLLALVAPAGDAVAEQLAIKTYNTEAGLAHNRVKRIVQDSHGFLWFCTADGLSRFDGYQFTNYRTENGLAGPAINDLLEASEGVYWIATNSDGVVHFDLAGTPPGQAAPRSRFTVYQISPDPVTNRVNVLYRDRAGSLWAGTDGGLFRMDGAQQAFRPVILGIPAHPDIQVPVWALVEDAAGDLWIGTRFGLVRRSADGRMTHFDIQPTAVDDNVWALLFERTGRLWVGHRLGLISFVPEASTSIDRANSGRRSLPSDARRYTTDDGLANNDVIALLQSRDGSIWARTFGTGLTRFNGGTLRTYFVGSRAGDDLAGVTEDRDGNLWMGTTAGGAVKVTTHPWTTYGEADSLGLAVSSVFQNGAGELYVTSSAWLVSRFEGNGFATIRLPLPRSVSDESWRGIERQRGIIQDHAGEWWIGTREGLFRFGRVDRFELLARARPKAVYTTQNGLPFGDVARLFEDSSGDIWIGSWPPSREALVRWERATATFHRYGEADGLRPFMSAVSFAADATSVWAGFREGGLARYRDDHFTMFGPHDGVPHGQVNGLFLDRARRLWVAIRGGGLCRIDEPQADRPRVIRYTTAEGLTSDNLLNVTDDPHGRIYVTGARGIDRLEPDTGRIRHLSTADGLAGGEFTAALRDRSGALWFATTTGLSRLAPEREPSPSAPPILISTLQIAGIAQPLSALGQTSVPPLLLGPSENNVQIEFFSLSFRPGETLRYQHRLEGTGADWSAPSSQRSVNFASLSPGTYRFSVRAVSADGTESPAPATASFTILPPVWRRWWFLGLMVIVAASVAAVFSRDVAERKRAHEALRRSREERLAELERVRKRIATDLHDDIGSSLTRISLLSEVMKHQVGAAGGTLTESLSSIAGLSRELVDSMSDIVWAINPTRDHLSDLSQRMRHFVSDVCTARQIDFRFETPPSDRDVAVGANIRREVFLVFKEAVTNLARHSACSEAVLEFREGEHGLLLRIADNGLGFDVGGASAGHGLRSMRDRTQALGGQFEIASEPGRGTVVTFTIPLGERVQPARAHAAGTNAT